MDYQRPESLGEALEILAAEGERAKLQAGGTDLVPQMNKALAAPALLVDISGLSELRGISLVPGAPEWITLGALTTFADLLISPLVAESLPALRQAAQVMGSPQIRSRATIGGNLGNASPAADSAPPLLVYEAEAEVAAAGGSRQIALPDLFRGPGELTITPDEMITSIRLRRPEAGGERSAFVKIGQRNALAISVVSLAARVSGQISGDNGQPHAFRSALVAVGAVAPTPIRVPEAEIQLTSGPLTPSSVEAASRAVEAAVTPIDDIRGHADYRREVVGVLLERALRKAGLRW